MVSLGDHDGGEWRGSTDVRNGNSLARIAEVLQHVLDQNGALSNDAVCCSSLAVAGLAVRAGQGAPWANLPTETSTPSLLVRVI